MKDVYLQFNSDNSASKQRSPTATDIIIKKAHLRPVLGKVTFKSNQLYCVTPLKKVTNYVTFMESFVLYVFVVLLQALQAFFY